MIPSFATEMSIFGAGGEDKREKGTIFDKNIDSIILASKRLDLTVSQIAFGEGQSGTGKKITNGFGKKPVNFSSENYRAHIQDLIQRIKSGEIKRSGNKLIVTMLTHGGKKMQGIQTHTIAVSGSKLRSSNANPSQKDESMDPFFELVQVAKKYGVQLAILDLSCHSGESLRLESDSACVITGSGPDHPSYGSFVDLLFSKMKAGSSIEEAFLLARAEDNSPSFPMISTRFGKWSSKILYKLVKPYLYYHSPDELSSNLKDYLESSVGCMDGCTADEDHESLVSLVKKTKDFGDTVLSEVERNELLKELQKYKEFQDQILEEMQFTKFPLLKTTEKIEISIVINNKTVSQEEEFSWKEILFSYPESSIDYFQKKLKAAKGSDRQDEMMNIARFEKIKQRRYEILKENEQLKDVPSVYDQLNQHAEKTRQSAYKISGLMNKMFVGYYRMFIKKYPEQKKSACSDFIL